MIEKLKYLITVASLIAFPILWKIQEPKSKIIGMGFITLLGLGWLVFRALKDGDFRIPKFLLFILAFILLQVVLFSNSPININGTYWIIFRLYVLFFFIFIVDQINSPDKRRFWENVLIGTAVVYAALDLIYVFSWYADWWRINGSLFPLPSMLLRSPGILVGHPNLQSSYLSLVTPFALVRMLSAKVRSARVFWFEILLILLAANFLTFSRGGWLALACALIVTLFLFYQPLLSTSKIIRLKSRLGNFGKYRFAGLAILVILLLGAGFLAAQVMGSTPHGTVSGRLDIYSYALKWISTSPYIGYGIGTVPTLFALRGYAIGGDEWYHTHNIWLEITLESGILGLVLVIAALCFILWAFRSAWIKRRDVPLAPLTLAASAGAGIAFLVHSLVDRLLWEASYVLAIAIVLGLIFSITTNKNFITLRKRFAVASLVLLLLTSYALLVFINRSHPLYWDGKTAAADGNWVSAREKICQAAEMIPTNTFYSFQCSLANAYVAKFNQDQDAITAAFQYQNRALELDPNWYIHWANLASYEWQLGEYDAAINHMQKAHEMAPNRTFLQVSLAWMFEGSGDSEQAYKYYRNAYCSNPGYQNTLIFQDSSIFQIVKQEDCPGENNRQAWVDNLWAGHQAREAGDLVAAEQYYQSAIPLNIESGAPYAYLALVHHQAGELEESQKDLRTAFLIENSSALNHEIAGRIALADGDLDKGYEHLYESFLLRRIRNFSRMYYAYTYFDAGIMTDLSPYIPHSIGSETRELFEQLAAYLADQGEIDKYQQVTQWLEVIQTP